MGFTGIIQTIGTVTDVKKFDNVVLWDGTYGRSFTLTILCPLIDGFLDDQYIGSSIAVDGVCLTVVELNKAKKSFQVNVAGHTLDITTLGSLEPHVRVNVEKAMKSGQDISGHEVQGHVDCTVEIIKKELERDNVWFTFSLPDNMKNLVVLKGYVALDGISLTVASTTPDTFSIMMIPHTQNVVALAKKVAGNKVNLEAHVLGKYVLNAMENMGLTGQQARLNRYASNIALALSAFNALAILYLMSSRRR